MPLKPTKSSPRRVRRITTTALLSLSLLVVAAVHVSADGPAGSAEHRSGSEGTRLAELFGQSILHVRGACIDDTPAVAAGLLAGRHNVDKGLRCAGEVSNDEGTFFLESRAMGGEFMVSWRPVDESLRTLRVSIAGRVYEGESPIRAFVEDLPIGEHEIRVEPARGVLGVHDQVVDWTAKLDVGLSFVEFETRGQSSYETTIGCAMERCDPLTSHSSDILVSPWRAKGTLTATWKEQDAPMRVTIPETGFAAEGESPLTMDVSGLTAGEWSVHVEPAQSARPFSGASVGWSVQLTRE